MTTGLALMFLSGPEDGRVLPLAPGQEVVFGRAQGCTVVLPNDPEVSRKHARLHEDLGEWRLEDLASTNGVYLGEFGASVRIVAETRVSEGAVFRIGRTRFRLASSSDARFHPLAAVIRG